MPRNTWVLGRDAAIVVEGKGFASCAGKSVTVAIYDPPEGLTYPVPDRQEFARPVTVAVSSGGGFQAQIPLPNAPRLLDQIRFARATGDCLAAPVDGNAIYFAYVESNPGAPAVIVIPADMLDLLAPTQIVTQRDFVGGLSVFANGQQCVSADFGKRGSGDVRILLGLPQQPQVCGTEGATLTFVDRKGRLLYMQLPVLRGATQVLRNLAPAEPPSTGGVQTIEIGQPEAVPSVAENSGGENQTMERWLPAIALGAALLLVAIVVVVIRSRRVARQ